MKKNILLIAGPVLAFTAVSCSLEENTEPVVDSVVPMEFSADAPATRTAITDGNAVIWSEDDAISVFDGAGNHKFTAGTAGSTTTKFSGEAKSGKETYYALYPYSADAYLAGTTIHSVLPANQYSTADGTFDTMLAPAVAKAEENGNLTFVNVAGLVKFTFTGAGDRAVKSISMTADQSLTGSYSVDMSGEEFSAVATASASAGETPAVSGITLTAKEGNLAAGPYYLVALPGTYSNVKISVVLSDGAKLNGSVGTLDIMAGKIKPTTIDLTEVQPTLYDKFMAGEDIVIAGKTYNKSQFDGEGQIEYVTKPMNIYSGSTVTHDGKIFFIDIENQKEPVQLGNIGDVVIVGVDPLNKPLLTKAETGRNLNLPSASSDSELTNGRVVLSNLKIDFSDITNANSGNYRAFIVNSAFGELTMDNCDISLCPNVASSGNSTNAMIALTNASRSINEINIVNCSIRVPVATTNHLFFSGSVTQTVNSFKFNNNIVYCPAGTTTDFALVRSALSTDSAPNQGLTISSIEVDNNTFVNTNTSSNYAIYTREITSISIKNNLVWSDIINTNCGMLRYSTAPTGTAMDNYAYIKTESTNDKGGLYSWQICFGGNSGLFTGAEQFEILRDTADPFSGGTFNLSTGEFQPSSEYSDYGAQR